MRRKYWSNNEILKYNAQYNIVIGGRNLGKSYNIKSYVLRNSWRDKTVSFVLMRRYDLECKPTHIENYFADTPVTEITGGSYNCITAKAGTLYFSNYDTNTGKTKTGIPCGKYVPLAGSTHVKSEAFPQVTDIIYEEFVATSYLGENEPDLLQSFVSTVARSRKIRVWLIGNTVNRMNPYIKKFGLYKISKQPQGSIETYDFHTTNSEGEPDTVKIAVEYCTSEGASNSMFFGTVAKSINTGAWECNEHPRLALPLDRYTIIEELMIEYINFRFILQLIANDETGKLCLYAYPYTNGSKKYERVLTLEYSEDPFHTVWFNMDDDAERIIVDLLNARQIAFSDNLTGDECIQALKSLKSSTL